MGLNPEPKNPERPEPQTLSPLTNPKPLSPFLKPRPYTPLHLQSQILKPLNY